MAGVYDIPELKRLAETNLLDDATCARMAHIARFFERLRKSVPEELQNLQVKDVYAEGDGIFDRLWRETAEEGTEVGRCPVNTLIRLSGYALLPLLVRSKFQSTAAGRGLVFA